MARYTDESKVRVRDAVDMVELVGSRTELRRSGADSYTALCPFHEERTPSFSVRPSEKLYYCFGCQARGDLFTFVMATEGVDFPAALELLADRFGVTLEVEEEDQRAAERRRRRERLLDLLERTCGYYERVLWERPEAARARTYLLDACGLEESVLRTFRVGYAPSAWDRVLLASRRGGFSEEELVAVGLAQRSRDRPGAVFDRFRARIMFPLCDQRGRVLGFGARATSDTERAKYLNSTDGEIYHKGQHLFGAHLARVSAAKAAAVVLCEGYTDVLAMHQSDVNNAVGLMGTALTEEQVAALGRLAPTVLLALDADGAGREAMLKAARLLADNRRELRVVPLPAGSDPADVLLRFGANAVRDLVARSQPLVRFQVERLLESGDRASTEGRDRILRELQPLLADLGPGAMREELEREIVVALGVSEKVVERMLAGRRDRSTTDRSERSDIVDVDPSIRAERAFVELCIALPERGRELLRSADLDVLFSDPMMRAAAAWIRSPTANDGAEPEGALADLLAELSVRASALNPVTSQLEVDRYQLELARLERAISGARAAAGGDVTALVLQREAVKRDLDESLTRALQATAQDRSVPAD